MRGSLWKKTPIRLMILIEFARRISRSQSSSNGGKRQDDKAGARDQRNDVNDILRTEKH
jgi:hypothetical protein